MKEDITFTYTNHRGETSVRLVRPALIYFGSTEYHTEPQWLMYALDLNKNADRVFAMKDIKDWQPSRPADEVVEVMDESGFSAGFGVGPRT